MSKVISLFNGFTTEPVFKHELTYPPVLPILVKETNTLPVLFSQSLGILLNFSPFFLLSYTNYEQSGHYNNFFSLISLLPSLV